GWGHILTWTNNDTAGLNLNGSGMVISQLPRMTRTFNGDIFIDSVITSGVNARIFPEDTFIEHDFLLDTLSHNTTSHEYIFTDPAGDQTKFFDTNTVWAAGQRLQFESFIDPNGNQTNVTAHTSDGKVQEVQRRTTSGGTTTVESYLYSYIASGTNAGLMQSVILRRQVNGGAWTN